MQIHLFLKPFKMIDLSQSFWVPDVNIDRKSLLFAAAQTLLKYNLNFVFSEFPEWQNQKQQSPPE